MKWMITLVMSLQLSVNTFLTTSAPIVYAEEVNDESEYTEALDLEEEESVDSPSENQENREENVKQTKQKRETDVKDSEVSEPSSQDSLEIFNAATAVPKEQYLSLGQTLSMDPNLLISSVTVPGYGTSTATSVELLEEFKADSIGSFSPLVKVEISSRTPNGMEPTAIVNTRIPVVVQWGDSLYFRGASDVSIGTFTYDPEEQKIVSNSGTAITPGVVHFNFASDSLYYSLNQHRLIEEKQLFEETDQKSRHAVTAGMQRSEAVTSFGGGSQSIDTEIGDIIEVYHREPGGRFQKAEDEQLSNVSMNNNYAYFELTDSGYKQLYFDRVKVIDGELLTSEMTHEDLDRAASEYLDLSQAGDVEIVGFVQYPDTSVHGDTTGVIRVQEKLSTGRYVQKDYEVAFSVNQFTYSSAVQEIKLGEAITSDKLETMLFDIHFEGILLDKEDYEISVVSQPDIIGEQTVRLKVSYGEYYFMEDLPVTVLWGDSLYFRGASDISIGTFTYDAKEQKIVSNPGTAISSGVVHFNFASDSVYYSLNQHRLTEAKQLFEETNKNSSHAVTAGMQRSEAVISFGGGTQSIDTEIGDIIEVYHREPGGRFQKAEDEQLSNVSMNNRYAYFELTDSGYKQLYFDRVIPTSISVNISKDIDNDALDKRIGEWLDLSNAPNVEIVGFSAYPDREKTGESVGKIRVQEKLSTGKYVQKDYLINFYVSDISFEVVPIEIDLGETLTDEKINSMVDNVVLNGKELSDAEYTISLLSQPDIIGKQYSKIVLVYENTEVPIQVPTNVLWGDSLYFRGASDISIGTFTYDAKEQKIVSNPGTAISSGVVHFNFASDSVYYSLNQHRLTEAKQLFEETNKNSSHAVTAGMQRSEAVTSFGGGTQSIDTEIGDIIEVYHREPGGRFQRAKDEHLSNVSMKDNHTYFELTDTGYKQLHFNRIQTETQFIPVGISEVELQERVAEFISAPKNSSIEAVKFVRYPVTSNITETTGTIRIQEKLSNDKYVMRDYTVPFIVSPVSVTINEPTLKLSEQIKKKDLKQIITDVLYDGNQVAPSEYTVDLVEQPDSSTIGRKEFRVNVKMLTTDEQISFIVNSTVVWEDTLLIRSGERISQGAITFFPEENELRASYGDATNFDELLSKELPEEVAFSAELFQLAEKDTIDFDSDRTLQLESTFYGKNTIKDVVDNFGEEGIGAANNGNILKIYMNKKAGSNANLFNNEVEKNVTSINDIIYFELTQSGFHKLNINQITPNDVVLSLGTTIESLDNSVEEYLNLTHAPNVEILGFKEYPKTSKAGETTGVITVQESMMDGKIIQKDYLVKFHVEYSNLRFMEVPSVFDFGSSVLYSSRHQWLSVENKDKNNMVTVYDGRETLTEWKVSAKASILVNSDREKDIQINGARYNFTLGSGDRKTIMADGLSSTMITQGVSTNENRQVNIKLNNLELFLPRLSGTPGEQFEGEIVWTIDMVP